MHFKQTFNYTLLRKEASSSSASEIEDIEIAERYSPEDQEMPINTTSASRRSSLASLFSQGTMSEDLVLDTNMTVALNNRHRSTPSATRRSSLASLFSQANMNDDSVPDTSVDETLNSTYTSAPSESRRSSLASLFSQGTMDDDMDPGTSTLHEPNSPHKLASWSPTNPTFGYFGNFDTTLPSRDSAYGSANGIYNAWPTEGSMASRDEDDTTNNTPSLDEAYDDSDDDDASSECSSVDETKEYEGEDGRSVFEYKLARAAKFRARFDSRTTRESRRRAIEAERVRVMELEKRTGQIGPIHDLAFYYTLYPEDIPDTPELEREREAYYASRSGYVDFLMEGCEDVEENLDTEAAQQELFGNWNWPKRRTGTALGPAFPVIKGPKDENVWLKVEPPRGCTWASLKEEQERKLEKYRGQQQQQQSQAQEQRWAPGPQVVGKEMSPKRQRLS